MECLYKKSRTESPTRHLPNPLHLSINPRQISETQVSVCPPVPKDGSPTKLAAIRCCCLRLFHPHDRCHILRRMPSTIRETHFWLEFLWRWSNLPTFHPTCAVRRSLWSTVGSVWAQEGVSVWIWNCYNISCIVGTHIRQHYPSQSLLGSPARYCRSVSISTTT